MKTYISIFLCFLNIASSHATTKIQKDDRDISDNDIDYFESDFLEGRNKENIDLSLFESQKQLAGSYFVYIYVNKNYIDAQKILFNQGDQNKLIPCLSLTDLKQFGIKTELFPALQKDQSACTNLSAIPDAKSEFDFNTQRLYLSMPQIALNNTPRGYIDLSQVDNGINAAMLNYSYNGSKDHSRTHNGTTTTNYINLRPSLNWGSWRFRNYSTWSNNDYQPSQWNNVYTYGTRNINQIKSQLTVGDGVTPSMVFDSVSFRGIQLATDNEMYPESLRGYAPTVRGIARSNAQITIRQNSYIIYQTNVAAGPFEINDLYPTGSSGDLQVTIKESNGSEQHQIVPFASLPILQREGYLFYSMTGGQYRSYNNHVDQQDFTQLSLVYGLPNSMTAYGGIQYSDNYQAQSLGLGKNLGDFGALSVDITYAHSTPNNSASTQGQSYRFRYNKNLNQMGTNITLAGYRYSTSGYYSLSEVFDGYQNTDSTQQIERRRNRIETSISQSLSENYGSVSVSYVNEDYWNSHRKTESSNISYSNTWESISYSLNYTYDKNTYSYQGIANPAFNHNANHLFAFSISVPFDFFDDTAYLNFNTNFSNKNSNSSTVGISASQLNNRFNWSMQQGYTNDNRQNTGNFNASYKGQIGSINGGSGYTSDNYNLYYGANGSLLIHSEGIVLGQQLGETAALVEIPQAPNIPITNNAGVSTNAQGYALVPNISPYRKNMIGIDVSDIPENTEMEITSQTVVPSRGAIVKTHFQANLGYRAFITLSMSNGQLVPFGAQAISTDHHIPLGMVDAHGKIFLSGLNEQGRFDIQFNNQPLCHVQYSLVNQPNYLGLYKTTAICH
ncbi:fimbria/pilus outer membrane usher protein [Providencia sp. PROV202]|uniref:fimbria/pilus outer membrane usher protein n=1 Tax=Providencia sp. PROV202 TaxID=2949902 RepID=UPI0023493E0E|nr:fimbria/pilus outer membrane usher protein [Providencia sp. PROV202]